MEPDSASDNTPQVILGIDPGLETTGYAVLESNGNRVGVLEAGTLTTNRSTPLPHRLKELFAGLEEILEQYNPARMAVEQLFSHYGHPKTAITMGHARGVLFLAAARKDVPVASYLPTKVKRTLTGNGRSSKEQVQRAIMLELGLDRIPDPPDIADAMAVAFCLHREMHCAGRLPE
jgi:crossover junction endodeoxyribonuclease RuvC